MEVEDFKHSLVEESILNTMEALDPEGDYAVLINKTERGSYSLQIARAFIWVCPHCGCERDFTDIWDFRTGKFRYLPDAYTQPVICSECAYEHTKPLRRVSTKVVATTLEALEALAHEAIDQVICNPVHLVQEAERDAKHLARGFVSYVQDVLANDHDTITATASCDEVVPHKPKATLRRSNQAKAARFVNALNAISVWQHRGLTAHLNQDNTAVIIRRFIEPSCDVLRVVEVHVNVKAWNLHQLLEPRTAHKWEQPDHCPPIAKTIRTNLARLQ